MYRYRIIWYIFNLALTIVCLIWWMFIVFSLNTSWFTHTELKLFQLIVLSFMIHSCNMELNNGKN